MASSAIFAVVAIFLVLQPTSTISDSLPPLLSPISDAICKEVECGKGTCKGSTNHPLGYICECQSGWKQTRSSGDDHFKFLPCVIPDCRLDYSCTKAPPPAPEKNIPVNSSFFDPCYWNYCGEGSCNRTSSKLKHKCECNQGSNNLMGISAFPCFPQCTLGLDCKNLGITVTSKSPSSSPSSPDLAERSKNKGSSVLPGSSNWLVISAVSLAMALWR